MADDKVIASIELSKALGLEFGKPISAAKLMSRRTTSRRTSGTSHEATKASRSGGAAARPA